jgi:hypothetical protein
MRHGTEAKGNGCDANEKPGYRPADRHRSPGTTARNSRARRSRTVNAAASHITLRYTMMEEAGRVVSGLRPRSALFPDASGVGRLASSAVEESKLRPDTTCPGRGLQRRQHLLRIQSQLQHANAEQTGVARRWHD